MSATPQNQTDAQTSELARGRLLFRDAHDLPPLDFVLPGLLRGTVGMLVGPGGIGKSMLALAIGAAVAGRWPVAMGPGGALFDTPTQGPVAIAFGEDPALVIQHRQEAFIAGLAAEQTAALDAAMGLDVRSTLGVDMRLVDTSCKPYAPGLWIDELRQLCTGRRLVIVDCLSLLHDADENDNSAMSAVMRALARVASEPVLRPKKIECDAARWQETAWGRCRVAGRLGQRHACLQNAILHTALGQHEESDGGITVLTDPYKLRVATGGGPQANYGGGIKRLIEDMIFATIEIIATPRDGRAGFSAAGHLIDHVVGVPTYMGREIPDPLHPGAARRFWAVRLGVCLAALLKHDLILYYDPQPIAALGHGISQAVARHVLSHKREPHGGWKLDRLIEVVGGPTGGQALRHRRQELRDDAAALRTCGLLVRGDRVHKSSENVQQVPGGVPQIPGTVAQIPGAFSKSSVAAASSAPSGLS